MADPDTITVTWTAVRWGLGALGASGLSMLSLVVLAVRMSDKLDTVAASLAPLTKKMGEHDLDIPSLRDAQARSERRIDALHAEKNVHARRLLAHGTTLQLVAAKVGVDPVDPESI